jgi:RNase P/RNase MRP subunit p30
MKAIVFPKANEEEFIKIAEKLGYSSLIFVYDYSYYSNSPEIKSKLNIEKGILCLPKEIKKAKNLSKYLFVQSSSKDREIIEQNKNIFLFDLETQGKKDFIHHRASGLNQVLCKLIKEHNISIGFSFSTVLKATSKDKLIGRIKQNIKFCKKYKIYTIYSTFALKPYEMRPAKDILSFFEVI